MLFLLYCLICNHPLPKYRIQICWVVPKVFLIILLTFGKNLCKTKQLMTNLEKNWHDMYGGRYFVILE